MTTAAPARTDADVQRDVLDELKWDARVQPNEIGIIVKDRIVKDRIVKDRIVKGRIVTLTG